VIERLPVTRMVAAALTSASGGLAVGRGKIPPSDDGVTPVNPPYYLLYALPLSLSGAPYADMNEDASLIYQVTSVSGPDPSIPQSAGDEDQAEWMADKARTGILGRNPVTGLWLYEVAPTGWRCLCRELDIEPGADSAPGDGIISYVQRFRFDLTPST
jgi:hypothetical protein